MENPRFTLTKLALRLIGVIAGLSVFYTAWFIASFGSRGMNGLLASGSLGIVTVVGWIITFVAGPVAFVQLLRVRNSGRVAAMVLFSAMLAYYVLGLVAFRGPGVRVTPIIALCALLVLLVGFLASKLAKRTCVGVAALDQL